MNLNSLFIKCITPPSQSFNYQIVRWRRPKKPFWLGIAKSKMFVIPQPKIVRTAEEKSDYARLSGDYEVRLASLLNFIKDENPGLEMSSESSGAEITQKANLEKMISESWKTNESWNAASAKLRDERMKISLEMEMEKAIREVDEYEEKKMKRMEMIEEIVRKEKDLSKTYITPENLDEAVENCLNKVVCYDFAIDQEGNKYEGRESLPSPFSKDNVQAGASTTG